MGYTTWFVITHIEGDSAQRLKDDFTAGVIDTSYGPLNELFEDIPGMPFDMMKWYDCHEDMRRISEAYPNTLIIMHGQGEDNDEWRAYYRNGEFAEIHPEIIWPDPPANVINNNVSPEDFEDLPDEDF